MPCMHSTHMQQATCGQSWLPYQHVHLKEGQLLDLEKKHRDKLYSWCYQSQQRMLSFFKTLFRPTMGTIHPLGT